MLANTTYQSLITLTPAALGIQGFSTQAAARQMGLLPFAGFSGTDKEPGPKARSLAPAIRQEPHRVSEFVLADKDAQGRQATMDSSLVLRMCETRCQQMCRSKEQTGRSKESWTNKQTDRQIGR